MFSNPGSFSSSLEALAFRSTSSHISSLILLDSVSKIRPRPSENPLPTPKITRTFLSWIRSDYRSSNQYGRYFRGCVSCHFCCPGASFHPSPPSLALRLLYMRAVFKTRKKTTSNFLNYLIACENIKPGPIYSKLFSSKICNK